MKPIISKNIRIRYPKFFSVGQDSIIDDYSYFAAKIKIGKCSHIASGCSIAGGKNYNFTMGDYSSISSGAKIWCSSNDFVNDIVTILPQSLKLKIHAISGDIKFGDYTAVGANAVVMPNNIIPVGTVIGALSFVPPNYNFEPWSVYAGTPIRLLCRRNRKNIINQIEIINSFLKRNK